MRPSDRFLPSACPRGSLLPQLLLLTFFPFEPCSARFSSGATVVHRVKDEGRVVGVRVIHADSQVSMVERDVAVRLRNFPTVLLRLAASCSSE